MKSKKIGKPVVAFVLAFITLLSLFPVGVLAASPIVTNVVAISGDFSHDPDVMMDGHKVSAKRYYVKIDGINYEAFCCDPLLRGPESAGAIYELKGEANAKLRNALKNGFPVNTEWSTADLDNDDRMYWAYVTRVAVAMANNTTRSFTGDTVIINQAKLLANGSVTADANAYPAIMVNGDKDTQDTGRTVNGATAQSQSFAVTYNRKATNYYNPFTFVWAAGTPAGAKLIVDGTVLATAPANSDKVFKDDITSFIIEMPNTSAYEGKTAAVDLVGVHNQFADKIWLVQHPTSPDTWQDIVFYIPEASASAAFSFTSEVDDPPPSDPPPSPPPSTPPTTSVVIQKIDALTRENIPGALMRLRGISADVVVTGGTVPSTGDTHWTLNNTGINLSQVLTAGATTASGEVKSTVSDGVWSLEGLPYGAYIVEEERAPDNYSLLPQHTAYAFWLLPPDVTVDVVDVNVIQCPETGEVLETIVDYEIREDGNTSSILITFENYPFGKIEVNKYDMVTELPLEGAHFRIQGYFAEGNTNGMPIDRVGVSGSDGKLVFEDLPAGHYTITEIEAPGGYELDYDEFRAISLTWGQTASTSFYNKPKTFVEVIKVDGDSGALLDGAIFRLTDPTSGEIWEGTTVGGKVRLGAGDGSYGNQLEAGTVYILTEIQAPPGYILDPSPKEVILAANNQLNIYTVRNFKKPTLTLIKLDELTNKPLSGASFRLWKTEGATWSETQVTDANGVITWTDLDPGIYSLQEIDEPYGYFKDTARKEILLEGGDNKQLEFFNRPRPVLTIIKRDQVTGEPLSGVKFRVQRLEGATIGDFVTDENGRIELSPQTGFLLSEQIYRVTEIQPPAEYLLGAENVRDVLLKWYEPTELIYENLLKPTLIFIKTNGLTGRGIDNATYKVEYEAANGGVVNLGTFKTKCGLIVLPHVQPGWYILTETIPAPGYSLPTNRVQRVYLAPGENSYTYTQTRTDLYVDPRTNPNSGSRGMCEDWCGYLCSVLCAGNCGNPGGGSMSGSTGGSFGNLTITNGSGDSLGTITVTPTTPPITTPATKPTLTAGAVTRNSNMTATVTFTSSAAGKYFYATVNTGAAEPIIATSGLGSNCTAGANTITVYLTAGAKDVYIKVKDADGNISDVLKVSVPAYEEPLAPQSEPTPVTPPNFDNMVITGGTVVYLNPDFAGITITFGKQ